MTCSHRSAAIAVAVILLVAGAQAAAERGKAISEKEGKQILAIFDEHRGLLRVMRRALDLIEKKPTKKANGKRGLLEESGSEEVALTLTLGTRPPRRCCSPATSPPAPSRRRVARPFLLLCPPSPFPTVALLRPWILDVDGDEVDTASADFKTSWDKPNPLACGGKKCPPPPRPPSPPPRCAAHLVVCVCSLPLLAI
jgi:hypothetical protein